MPLPPPPPPLDCAVQDKLPELSVFKTSPGLPSDEGHFKPLKITLPFPSGNSDIFPLATLVVITFPFTSKSPSNWVLPKTTLPLPLFFIEISLLLVFSCILSTERVPFILILPVEP